jgi:hypothetical protein
MPTSSPKVEDYDKIARELRAGDVVPFLGAGASIGCGLPSGSDLARRLVRASMFPDQSGSGDLARVASWVALKEGTPWLRRELREVFGATSVPGPLHECLASLGMLRLVVTTNYDDLIEMALDLRWRAEGKKTGRHPWVVVDRGYRNSVWVRQPEQPWNPQKSNSLERIIRDPQQPIVFKMHGSINREIPDEDEYLITEEQYIDYLGRGDKIQIPPMIEQIMLRKHFLFLGYGLRDWNVRVLISKLRKTRPPGEITNAWAVIKRANETETQAREAEKFLWDKQGVTMLEVELDEFVAQLRDRL